MSALKSVDPLLEVKDLRVDRGGVSVVRGLTVRVFAGTVAAIVGPSGAGKSLALRAVARLVPSTGDVTFEGKRTDELSARQAVRLGIVLVADGRSVFERLTIRENLAIGAWTRADRYAVRHEMAALFDRFPDLGRRPNLLAGDLSAGERQLLAIARAMMAKPRLLLLDEPSTGLPPERVAEIFEVITRLNSDGLPVLMAEQYERKALALSDYVYVMDRGVIAKQGVPREIAHEPEIEDAHLGPARA